MSRVLPILGLAGLAGCIEPQVDTNPFIDGTSPLTEFRTDWSLDNVVTGEAVSPSNFSSHVAAYYFGHAT